MFDDPRLVQLRHTFENRPALAAPRQADLSEAAVALLVRPHEQLELLLIKRAERAGDPWSGHVAFPGGRRQPGDADLMDTAARETEEETGIALRRLGTFVGSLDEVAPVWPLLPHVVIAPYVVVVPPSTLAVPDPREVQAALWVPLEALRDERATAELTVELLGGSRSFPAVSYGDYVIWGLTHRILTQFLELTAAAGL